MAENNWTERALAMARVDPNPAHRPPATWRVVLATVLSVGGSLGIDALLVALGTKVFPSTNGYTHFRFSDYSKLTVIGVIIACVAWPITVRISSAPRWLFFRMAILVTLVLWLPDLYILVQGQQAKAVAVLIVMHLTIALVTYNVLVHLAPPRQGSKLPPASRGSQMVRSTPATWNPMPAREVPLRTWPMEEGREPVGDRDESEARFSALRARRGGLAMASLVGLELLLGIGALLVVPYSRPDVWVPTQGRALYLVHAVLGGILGLSAAGLVFAARRAERMARLAMIVGFVGVVIAAGGGFASVDHPTRLLGLGLMMLGTATAGFGYLIPVIEAAPTPASPLEP